MKDLRIAAWIMIFANALALLGLLIGLGSHFSVVLALLHLATIVFFILLLAGRLGRS